jgi:hypothetical protein
MLVTDFPNELTPRSDHRSPGFPDALPWLHVRGSADTLPWAARQFDEYQP